jgi:hypothetical protein
MHARMPHFEAADIDTIKLEYRQRRWEAAGGDAMRALEYFVQA